ncbi:MAG: hypothetical protein IPG85_08390, partial [Bacteroidetes bacterium]|nr:hypothetical protein [Bacteroidota bacterium]
IKCTKRTSGTINTTLHRYHVRSCDGTATIITVGGTPACVYSISGGLQ